MATPTDWLQEADGDLAAVRAMIEKRLPKHACFQAQQAAEKALKGLLLGLGEKPPKIHALGKLLDRIRACVPSFPDHSAPAKTLTPYYTWVRYPDLRPPGAIMPTMEKAEEALRLAEAIVADARARIAPPSPPPPAPAAPAAP